MAFSLNDKLSKEKKLNFVLGLPNLSGTALFEEIAKCGVQYCQYYVCVSTQATETKTKFGAHRFF